MFTIKQHDPKAFSCCLKMYLCGWKVHSIPGKNIVSFISTKTPTTTIKHKTKYKEYSFNYDCGMRRAIKIAQQL